MENINPNYKKISLELLRTLPQRQREVISRRFGLENGKGETLEAIGQDFKITRERVRQIECDGLKKLKERIKPYQSVIEAFLTEFEKSGGLRKEESLLLQLGGKNWQPHVVFLLTLAEPFKRIPETEEFHSVWVADDLSLDSAREAISAFSERLKEANRPMRLEEFKAPAKINASFLPSFLELSKTIQKNQEGFLGFREWPEINPRGIKNKAYVVFKKENRPLHFVEVAKLIGPEALSQTVHNELIKDPRFVLVGRGLYALKEWGYETGQVKDVIMKALKAAKKPLSKDEILAEVLKQRMVKENTVLLNLNNKKYFFKTPEGKYFVQKS